MTETYRALCVELVKAWDAPADFDFDFNDFGHAAADIVARARAALAQPEPVATEGRWSEGVCGDGAAILKDGVMQPIEDVIAALNATALAQSEPVAPVSDSEMAAYNDRAAARFAILDRLEKAIDFNSNGGWRLTPEGEHWQRIMDEQGRDEYEMGI